MPICPMTLLNKALSKLHESTTLTTAKDVRERGDQLKENWYKEEQNQSSSSDPKNLCVTGLNSADTAYILTVCKTSYGLKKIKCLQQLRFSSISVVTKQCKINATFIQNTYTVQLIYPKSQFALTSQPSHRFPLNHYSCLLQAWPPFNKSRNCSD